MKARWLVTVPKRWAAVVETLKWKQCPICCIKITSLDTSFLEHFKQVHWISENCEQPENGDGGEHGTSGSKHMGEEEDDKQGGETAGEQGEETGDEKRGGKQDGASTEEDLSDQDQAPKKTRSASDET